MGDVFRVRLLGPIQVEREGQPVLGLESGKPLALLGYLIVQDTPVSREYLADLFWRDKPEDRGRANLSWTLHKISSLLPGCLETSRHTVRFQRTDSCWLDLDVFEELMAQGKADALADVVELYRGDLLEGLSVDGCPDFEIWLVGERERWRERVAQVLRELVAHHGQRGEYEQGLRFARRLLTLEPWREETHQQVMRLLAQNGRRGAALAQYETCRRLLTEELGVEPGTETTRLYEQIRDGALGTPLAPSAHPPSFLGEREPVERPVFVARECELAQLDRFLDAALAGRGRVVFVTGDAGQGKTALIQEFARRAQSVHAGLVVTDGNGNAHTGIGDPYLPFRQVLGLLTGDVKARWDAGAMGREQARRLWYLLPLAAQALLETGPDLVDTFVAGAALVRRGLAVAPGGAGWLSQLERLVERKAAIPCDPNLQQSALFEQYTRVLRVLASRHPLLLVLDDLQWADAGSISLLFHLGRQIAGTRILIVGAYRPAEVALGRPVSPELVSKSGEERKRHPLQPVVNELKRDFGDIEVALGQDEGRRFVEALLDTEPNRLSVEFRETLYRQTGGHPLFTVELLRGMQERGDLIQDAQGRRVEGPALDWETLPARVEAVIAERVGRLPERLRRTLTVASVEGETFTAEAVAQVRAADDLEMVNWLSRELDRRHRLVSAHGIRPVNDRHLSLYRFRHILFQKYLYNRLDPVERVHLHRAVGTALETLHGARPDGRAGIADVSPQLARHFQEGGVPETAVAYLLQAGKRAARMSAHREAIAHLAQGLGLIERLPDTPARTQQELALQIALAVPLQATRGYAAPEVGRTYARARELCRQVEGTPQLFSVLWLLALFYAAQGKHRTAYEISEQLLDLAEQAQDPVSVALARYMLGPSLLFLGELAQARAHLEWVIAFYDPQQHHSLAFLYGQDLGVSCLSFASWALWALGCLEQALKRSQEALALARELDHPLALVFALSAGTVVQHFCRDVRTTREMAESLTSLSTVQGFPYHLALGTICRGWALAEQGQVEEGIAQMHQGLADYRSTGAELGYSLWLAMLAGAYGKIGQAEEGLDLLAEALATAHRNGEHFCEAEIHRLKGELLLMQGETEDEVEQHYGRAIEVARRQGARSWELRATMSLCRLWQKQGRREEARQLLAEIYGWFAEGFDTADLREARVLLEEQ
jgi:DNA-binding SARP family transcriptional activator/predicted ATPase